MKVILFLLAFVAVAVAVPAEKCEWKSFHYEDYTHGAVGWSNNSVSECDCRSLLGGAGKFAGGEVHKTIKKLPAHTHLRLKANYYFLDDWDKETAFAKIDDKLVWTKESSDKSWRGINVCGNEDSADFINEIVDVVVPHDDGCVKVTFGSNLDEPASNEAWGLANMHIYTCVYDHKPKCSEE